MRWPCSRRRDETPGSALQERLGPRHPLGDASGTTIWFSLACMWSAPVLFVLLWLAARISAAIAGGRVAPLGADWALHVLAGRDEVAWPGTPTALVAGIAIAGLVLLAAAGMVLLRGRGRADLTPR